MICSRCNTSILKGEKYHRTRKGPHHASCPHVSVAIPNDGGSAVVTRDDRHDWRKLSVTAIAAENQSVMEYIKQLEEGDPERIINTGRSTAWAAWQVLGCLFGIHGPARIMNWFWDVAHGEGREVSLLFPITDDERSKYAWNELPLLMNKWCPNCQRTVEVCTNQAECPICNKNELQ